MFRFASLFALPLALSACISTDMPSAATARATAACSAASLDPNEAPFADCVRSLRALSDADVTPVTNPTNEASQTTGTATPTQQADAACSAFGLTVGTVTYSACIVNLRATFEDAARFDG